MMQHTILGDLIMTDVYVNPCILLCCGVSANHKHSLGQDPGRLPQDSAFEQLT